MSEWMNPPQREVPFVFGSASTTSGYYALEDAGRANAAETLSHHQREATLWYRALTLHLDAQQGKWPPLPDGGSELQRYARNTQIDLLALSLCSSKAALDMILAGYYSVGWAAIRHCAEVSIHCHYLAHFPATYQLYYAREDESEDPPRCRQMVDQIKSCHRNDDSPTARTYGESLESIYTLWRLMSLGVNQQDKV